MSILVITVSSTLQIHQKITIDEKKIIVIDQEIKKINKRTSLIRKGNKRNFKFCIVNYEEQNYSNSDSNPSFDFCFKIITNIVKDNFNNSSITPKNIKVNKVKAEILKEENNDRKNNSKES